MSRFASIIKSLTHSLKPTYYQLTTTPRHPRCGDYGCDDVVDVIGFRVLYVIEAALCSSDRMIGRMGVGVVWMTWVEQKDMRCIAAASYRWLIVARAMRDVETSHLIAHSVTHSLIHSFNQSINQPLFQSVLQCLPITPPALQAAVSAWTCV